MPKYAVILPAAGQSLRFGGKEKKPFATIDGRAVWLRSAELFVTRDEVIQTLLVLSPQDIETFRINFMANIAFMNIKLVEGGAERTDSIANALNQVSPDAEFIAVHDAVRCCTTAELIDSVFAAAVVHGAAIPALPVTDTLKNVAGFKVQSTAPRANLWKAQTPQVFRKEILVEAYARRDQVTPPITDDSQLVESLGLPIHVVEGDATNIKITTRRDLTLADAIYKSRPKPKVASSGHPFAEEGMWK
jgi:2-C-methyl-D-erythritol 4-phosphate cytidylyltransferase